MIDSGTSSQAAAAAADGERRGEWVVIVVFQLLPRAASVHCVAMKFAPLIRVQIDPHRRSAPAWSRRAILATVLCAVGCQPTERALSTGEKEARSIIGSVDPTGAIAETEERKKLWTAARKRFEELDIARFNQTVEALGAAVQRLDERVAAIDVQSIRDASAATDELMKAARAQIEQANLEEISAKAAQLAADVDLRVQSLSPDQLATIVAGIAESVARLHQVIAALDGRLATVATGAESLSETAVRRVNELPIAETRDALLRLRSAVDEIGVAAGDVRRAAALLPAASSELESALRWARTMLITATGVLTIAGVSLLAWLFRGRPKGSPSA